MMKAARNWSSPPPMPATKPSAIFARSPIFGCMALDQCRQVGVRRRPDRMQLFADHGPRRDGVGRSRDLERVFLHVDDQLMHRVAQRTHQHRGWHDDQGDAEEDHDRRRKPLLASDLVGKVLVQRIERDGQNQGPDHQGQERREDLVAKHDQRQDEAGTDEHVQQPGRVALPRFAVKLVVHTSCATPTVDFRAEMRNDGALAWTGNAAPV